MTTPLTQALEAQAAGDALTEFAEKLSARIPEGSPTEDHEDVIEVILELREEANQKKIEAALLRSTADEPLTEPTPDTLPAWLQHRFDPRGPEWDALDEDDRAYWEHQARAVRRAVARSGFKQPTTEAQQNPTRDSECGARAPELVAQPTQPEVGEVPASKAREGHTK